MISFQTLLSYAKHIYRTPSSVLDLVWSTEDTNKKEIDRHHCFQGVGTLGGDTPLEGAASWLLSIKNDFRKERKSKVVLEEGMRSQCQVYSKKSGR